MALDANLKSQLDNLVQSHDVVLFMKGTRRMPQCGFSSRVVGILDGLLDDYQTVNVLAEPAIREGIKEYSDWPTIPQLYVKGEFQGGCDIVTEMAGSGELHQALGIVLDEVEAPEFTVSESAAQALKAALSGEAQSLRFRIGPGFRYELNLGDKLFGDIEVAAGGVTFLLDRGTAKIAGGTSIDFVKGPMGEGFVISNPNEPAKVKQIRPAELKDMMADETVHLFDVRTEQERATATLGAPIFDAAARAELEDLDREAIVVFHCHHGGRSQAAAEQAIAQGFKNVFNLAGGIDAWSREVDSSIPRY